MTNTAGIEKKKDDGLMDTLEYVFELKVLLCAVLGCIDDRL
jgi:hypothetical protein